MLIQTYPFCCPGLSLSPYTNLLVLFIHDYQTAIARGSSVSVASTASRGMASDAYKFETLKVTAPDENILHVELNRPEKRNAMNSVYFRYVTYHLDCMVYAVKSRTLSMLVSKLNLWTQLGQQL